MAIITQICHLFADFWSPELFLVSIWYVLTTLLGTKSPQTKKVCFINIKWSMNMCCQTWRLDAVPLSKQKFIFRKTYPLLAVHQKVCREHIQFRTWKIFNYGDVRFFTFMDLRTHKAKGEWSKHMSCPPKEFRGHFSSNLMINSFLKYNHDHFDHDCTKKRY